MVPMVAEFNPVDATSGGSFLFQHSDVHFRCYFVPYSRINAVLCIYLLRLTSVRRTKFSVELG